MKRIHLAGFFFALTLLLPLRGLAEGSCMESQLNSQEGPELFTEPEPAGDPLPELELPEPMNHGSDLTVSRAMASSRLYTQRRYFYAGGCAYNEGCVAAPGWRRILRFYTRVINRGTENFHIGNPADPGNADNVQWDSCHGHYHMKEWANYELLSSDGTTVVKGRKQAFCLMDSTRISGSAARRYSCRYQGITAGWADDYADTLTCQWLDITGLPPGSYQLRITVNPARRYIESDYTNNLVTVPVRIR